MISTDKAIEPVSMLGLTKRFAEMYCQALDHDLMTQSDGKPHMRLISVRFGNVLASNGSVVPKFKAQIEAGGPVTVTHPDMVRYFMTIREACDLVLTAATHALTPARPDVSVYVLNMGQPVKIVELAERMIRLSGLEPGIDIEIVFTGMRPGERLNEILFASEEPTGGDRRRRHHGGQAERAADADLAQMARGAGGGDRAGTTVPPSARCSRMPCPNSDRTPPDLFSVSAGHAGRFESHDAEVRKSRRRQPALSAGSEHDGGDHGGDFGTRGAGSRGAGAVGNGRLRGAAAAGKPAGRRSQELDARQGRIAQARFGRTAVHDPDVRRAAGEVAAR